MIFLLRHPVAGKPLMVWWILAAFWALAPKADAHPQDAPSSSEQSASESATDPKVDLKPAQEELDVLRIALSDRFEIPDPHHRAWNTVDHIFSGVYEKLWHVDAEGGVGPSLATEWSWANDRLLKVKLRTDVQFHDGSSFGAEDVVFSFDRARDFPEGEQKSKLARVKEVRVVDRHTLDIHTVGAAPLLIRQLAGLAIVPGESPKKIVKHVGTGPYRWGGSPGPDRHRLTAYEDYWGRQPGIRHIDLVMIPSLEDRFKAVEAGDVDLSPLPFHNAPEVETRDDLWIFSCITPGVIFLGLQIHKAPLDDVTIRRAIDLAVDREALVHDVFHGYARAAAQLAGPGSFGYDVKVAAPARNLDEARRLLAAAGQPSPTLHLHSPGAQSPMADAVAAQLRDAGFQIKIQNQEWPDLISSIQEGKAPAFLLGWTNPAFDLGDVFEHFLHSKDEDGLRGLHNDTYYSNADVDRWIDQAGSTLDSDERLNLLRKISTQATEDAVLLPLVWQMRLWVGPNELDWTPRRDGVIYPQEIRRARNK